MNDAKNTTSDMDLISSLGLAPGDDTVGSSELSNDDKEPATSAPRAERTELKIVGKIATGAGALPAEAPRGGGFGGKRGSKYPFEDLEAPAQNKDGSWAYSFFTITLADVENADDKKLRGAIQAAVAQQNKQAKEANEKTKYVSRTVLDASGAYAGSSVYRVDDTLDAAE
jgi:hypothetical protein